MLHATVFERTVHYLSGSLLSDSLMLMNFRIDCCSVRVSSEYVVGRYAYILHGRGDYLHQGNIVNKCPFPGILRAAFTVQGVINYVLRSHR